MRNIFIVIILVIFTSCEHSSKKAGVQSYSSDSQETKINFAKTVFEKGEAQSFTDSCKFYFQCDCCSGKIIFNSDSSFYEISYCEANEGVVYGYYSVSNNFIILKYSGLSASTEDIEAYQENSNSSMPKYFNKDTITKSSTYRCKISFCGEKIKLTGDDKKEISISTKDSYLEAIKDLEKQDYIKRLKKLK
jgi:hypothetical protein